MILGASLWGTIGVFVEILSSAGFTSLQIVTLRVVMAALLLVAYLGIMKPSLLQIRLKDWYLFAGSGVLSIVFFNWCYFTAIEEASLSVAVMLLYTGPAFVVFLSRLFFNEIITLQKTIALLVMLSGCVLVVQLFPISEHSISTFGIIVGLGSGLGYALYSIFGKVALRSYSSMTIITYTFVFASLALIPTSGIYIDSSLLLKMDNLWPIIGLGLLPTALAYLLYTIGLSKIETGKASLTATVEPVVASFIGVTIFGDILSALQVFGIILILGGVVILQWKRQVSQTVNRTA